MALLLLCWDGSFARVEFLIVKEGTVYLLEVDEGQHVSYGVVCDVVRMTNVHMSMVVEGKLGASSVFH